MFNDQMNGTIENLVSLIKNSGEYQAFIKVREEVKKNPEKSGQIDAFRKRNYEMNRSTAEVDWLEEMENIEREYAEFRKDPLVRDFLAAELALCRMIQEISCGIFGALDFDVDFLS